MNRVHVRSIVLINKITESQQVDSFSTFHSIKQILRFYTFFDTLTRSLTLSYAHAQGIRQLDRVAPCVSRRVMRRLCPLRTLAHGLLCFFCLEKLRHQRVFFTCGPFGGLPFTCGSSTEHPSSFTSASRDEHWVCWVIVFEECLSVSFCVFPGFSTFFSLFFFLFF